jgi:hypothetical protein
MTTKPGRRLSIWLLRAAIVLGFLVLPSLVPLVIFWGRTPSVAASPEIPVLRAKVAELTRRLEALEVRQRVAAAPAPSVPVTVKPESDVESDPVEARVERRLALVQTLVRWRKGAGSAFETEHFAAGMGVVRGARGELVVAQSLANPWTEATWNARRKRTLEAGGSATVHYRFWGVGVNVLDLEGALRATATKLVDRAPGQQPLGVNWVLLQGQGFEPASADRGPRPIVGDPVVGYRWPEPSGHPLPSQTRPLRLELRFGRRDPVCPGCYLFDQQGRLVGQVDRRGDHVGIPR